MGYLIDLPQDRSFLGLAIPEAYHSIDTIVLQGSKVVIEVTAYMSRQAKYTVEKRQAKVLAPEYLPVVYDDDGEPLPQEEEDIAQYTSIRFEPYASYVRSRLCEYVLTIDADKLFKNGLPFDLSAQKQALYPTIKRLLGHANGIDVIEETVVEDVPPTMEELIEQ